MSPGEGGMGPRPSLGEFIPSPGPGAFDPDSSMIAGPSRLRGYGFEVEAEDDILDEDEFQLARSYFDTKEFDRVVYTLKHARGKRAVFLRTYSAYLVSLSMLVIESPS
jgi:anaphase-promoting complex subunit 8